MKDLGGCISVGFYQLVCFGFLGQPVLPYAAVSLIPGILSGGLFPNHIGLPVTYCPNEP